MARFTLLVALLLVISIAFAQKKKSATYADGLYAEVNTSKGLIVLQLEYENVPMTVANFVGLAEGTVENKALPGGRPFYNGSKWHRVVPGHVIQCGRPGGSTEEGPGYSYPNEIVPGLSHDHAGVAGIANGGPHTNGSQWYITLADRSYLDGDYTIFGHVIRGLEVLPLITQTDSIKTVDIIRMGTSAKAFKPTTALFRTMVEAQKVAVQGREEKSRADLEELIRTTWPQVEPYMRQAVIHVGEGPVPRRGDTLTVRYNARIPAGDSFVSTSDGGKPWYGVTPSAFRFIVGTTTINPGFDAGVSQMRKGEKRVLIVPAAAAYGAGGYYPPERKGERRFHVGPHKTIIYEVEVLK